jgi:hypothetical protein
VAALTDATATAQANETRAVQLNFDACKNRRGESGIMSKNLNMSLKKSAETTFSFQRKLN